jgi:peptidyl-prolyl cis-trans isomerase D
MLSFFRRFIGSRVGAYIALGFLLLIGIAFAAGDITGRSGSGALGSLGGSNAAKVGGSTLSVSDLQSRVQRVFEQSRRSNPGTQMATFLAEGGVEQVYDQLIAGLAVSEFGGDQGMAISKRMVDAQIAAIPAFQDASGTFSQDAFRRLLANENLSEKALRDDITRDLAGKQLIIPATLGVALPNSLVLPYASLLLEARTGRIAAIPAQAFIPPAEPTEAQLKDFYARSAVRFTVPEQRQLRYAVIDLDRFAGAAQPTEAEVNAYYNQNRVQYAASETRSFEQLILPTEAAAKTIAADVRTGKSLAAAAQTAGLAVAALTNQSPEMLARLSSADVAKAGFAAPKDGLVGPIRAPLGWALLRVTAIDSKPAQAIDQVRPKIVDVLKGQKQQKLLADFTGKIEDQVGDGATFDEVAKDNALSIETTPFVLSTGQSVQRDGFVPSADIKPLLAPGFAMDADDDAQLVPITPDKRYALIHVGQVTPAAPPPLDKVKAAVSQQYKLAEGDKKAAAIAEQVRLKVSKGVKLEAAMAAVGVPLPPVQPIGGRRADLMRGDKPPPPPIALLFSMVRGSIKTLPLEGGRGYVLVQLDQIQQGDAGTQPQLVNQVREQLSSVIGGEYGDQFEHAIEQDLKVSRNLSAVAGVKQELRRANGGAQ